MDRTCRWTPIPGSPAAVARAVAGRLADADESQDGWLRRRSATEPAANTRAFPARSRSAPPRCELLLVEFGRSAASWAGRLVFVNGHGGNVEALAAAAALLRYEGRDVGVVLVQRAECRRPRRTYRNVCIATYFAGGRAARGDRAGQPRAAGRADACDAQRWGGGGERARAFSVIPTTATATTVNACSPRWSTGVRGGSPAGSRTATGC